MTGNILVNALMEIDDLHEGSPVVCGVGLEKSTEGPNRWFSQLVATGAEVTMQRIVGPSAPGSFTFCRLEVLRPARELVDLDRLQLFQPIESDELFGLTTGDGAGDEIEAPPALEFSFAIRTNVEIEVGCTLNSGAAVRNFTTNRRISAGGWQAVRVVIPRDRAAPWPSSARFGMFFQIGLSCGPTRLSTADGVWNDGHALMIENPTAATFLTTEGAVADVTRCYLGPATASAMLREPTIPARARTQRFIEKSYFAGTAPGKANEPRGAFEIVGQRDIARGRVQFQTLKLKSYRTHLYSPVTGAEGFAHDLTARRDVPAAVREQTPQSMVVDIPGGAAGHTYRFHWLVHDFV